MGIHTFVKICRSEHSAHHFMQIFISITNYTFAPVCQLLDYCLWAAVPSFYCQLCDTEANLAALLSACSTLPIEGDRGGLGVWRKKKEIILASFCSFPVSCLCVAFVHHSSHIFTHIAEYPTHNSSRIQCAVFQPLQNLPYQHSQEIPAPGWHLLFRVLGPRPTGPLLYDQRHWNQLSRASPSEVWRLEPIENFS